MSKIVDMDLFMEGIGEFLGEGKEVVMTPKGNSMLPFIRGGVDRVVLRRKPAAAVGDIVLAKIGDRFILHRVISRKDDALTLMGDGNVRGTEACRTEDVIGTVAEIIRPSGHARTPGKACAWRALRPLRRYLLAIYRRLI